MFINILRKYKVYIMESTSKIKLPVPYKPHEKIDNKLKSLNKTGTKKTLTFIGSDEVEAMFYLYLFKKYKSNCFLHDENSERRLLGMSILISKNYEPHETEEIQHQLDNLSKILVNCITNVDTKIIIIPVQLIFDNGGGHANVLIYRKNLNQIEHFEPHGQNFSKKQEDINKIIEKWMKFFVLKINAKLALIKKPEVKFVESSEVCPYINGLQNLESLSDLIKIAGVEPGGYCAAWSMFFTELCLKNPEISSSTLINYIFNTLQLMNESEKRNYLKSVIRGYSVFVNEKINKYFSIFYKSGLTIEIIKKLPLAKLDNFRNILKNLINVEMNLSTDPLYLQKIVEEIDNEYKKLMNHLQIMTKNKTYNSDIVYEFKEIMSKKDFIPMYNNFNKNKFSSPTSHSTSLTNNKLKVLKSIPEKDSKSCPEGKELNLKTGRCVKIKIKTKTKKQKIEKVEKVEKVKVKVEPLIKSCPEGKEINPKTGRCIKIKTQKVKKVKIPKMKTSKITIPQVVIKLEPEPKLELQPVLEPVLQPEIKMTKSCPPGKEINPKTGRCIKTKTQKVKKIKTPKVKLEKVKKIKTLKSCPEGKEINPKTGRCIKTKVKKVKLEKEKTRKQKIKE
jgi:hypothetical protein